MTARFPIPDTLVSGMSRYGITALEVRHLAHIGQRELIPHTPESWYIIAQAARETVWARLEATEEDWMLLHQVIVRVSTQENPAHGPIFSREPCPLTPGQRVRRKERADGWTPATVHGVVVNTSGWSKHGKVLVEFTLEPGRQERITTRAKRSWTAVAQLDPDPEHERKDAL